ARVLSPMGVARMTEAHPIRGADGNAVDGAARGIGWDIFTSYSANRGDLFPVGSFRHTRFTGTGLWIDPSNETCVVFLSNRVHPGLGRNHPADVSSLRGRVASVVASSIIEGVGSGEWGVGNRGAELVIKNAGHSPLPTPYYPLPNSHSLNGIDVL